VGSGEGGQQRLAVGGEPHPDHAVVVGIGGALHEIRLLCAIDQLDSAVVAEQEVAGDVADRRVAPMPPDGQQQLVLRRRQALVPGLLLAPVEEAPELVAQVEELLVVPIGQRSLARLGGRHIVTRYVVTVSPQDSAAEALHRMLDEDVEHLPVVDDGRLVGICTRTDVLKARR